MPKHHADLTLTRDDKVSSHCLYWMLFWQRIVIRLWQTNFTKLCLWPSWLWPSWSCFVADMVEPQIDDASKADVTSSVYEMSWSGPRTGLCGFLYILCETSTTAEYRWRQNVCVLSLRYDWNHCNTSPSIPNLDWRVESSNNDRLWWDKVTRAYTVTATAMKTWKTNGVLLRNRQIHGEFTIIPSPENITKASSESMVPGACCSVRLWRNKVCSR